MASGMDGGKEPGQWEKEEDSGLSMLDVLEEQEQLEEDANAVLGGSDDKNCTYDMVKLSVSIGAHRWEKR